MTPLSFRLIATHIDEFAFFGTGEERNDDFTNFRSELGFSWEKDITKLSCYSSVICESNNGIIAKAAITFTYEFDKESIEPHIDKKKGKLIIPTDTLFYFATKTYGALRGVLLAKLQEKNINMVLPLSNMTKIIGKPLEIEIEQI